MTKPIIAVGDPVDFPVGGIVLPCVIIAQRHYTDRYNHWDVAIARDVLPFSKGQKFLGIPEHALAKENT